MRPGLPALFWRRILPRFRVELPCAAQTKTFPCPSKRCHRCAHFCSSAWPNCIALIDDRLLIEDRLVLLLLCVGVSFGCVRRSLYCVFVAAFAARLGTRRG